MALGAFKHLGFSVHGNYETFMRFLEAYGDTDKWKEATNACD